MRLIIATLICFTFPITAKAELCLTFEECLPLARNGDVDAQIAVAGAYLLGRKVPKDTEKAFTWFRMAAHQNNAEGQFTIASMYDNGEGVKMDAMKAFVWYFLAAENGDKYAQSALGDYYLEGFDIPQDINKAYIWFSIAAENGDKYSKEKIIELEKSMSEKEKELLQKKVIARKKTLKRK